MKLRALLLATVVLTTTTAYGESPGGWGWLKDIQDQQEAAAKQQKSGPGAPKRNPGTWTAPTLPEHATAPLAVIFGPNWYLPTQNTVPGGINHLLPGARINRHGWIDQNWAALSPPTQYDHPFKGDLIVIRTSMRHVREICPPFQPGIPPVACATHDNPATWCRITLAHDEDFQAVGWNDPQQILRHETAHCNGWPADHPGAR